MGVDEEAFHEGEFGRHPLSYLVCQVCTNQLTPLSNQAGDSSTRSKLILPGCSSILRRDLSELSLCMYGARGHSVACHEAHTMHRSY